MSVCYEEFTEDGMHKELRWCYY